MAFNSSTVAAGDDATATQYNNLRTDMIERVAFSGKLLSTVSDRELVGIFKYPTDTSGANSTFELNFGFSSADNEKSSSPIIGDGVSMSTIRLYLRKFATPVDNVVIRIETDNSGSPSGTLAHANATGSFTGGSLTTSLALTTVSFAGSFTLTDNTKYHIVCTRSGSLSATNYYAVGYTNQTIGRVPIGDVKVYESSAWVAHSSGGSIGVVSTQVGFYLSGYARHNVNLTTDYQRVRGFAMSAGVLGDTIYIQSSGVLDGFSGLTDAKNYFPSTATAGVISTTNQDPKVGESVSTTKMYIQIIYNNYTS